MRQLHWMSNSHLRTCSSSPNFPLTSLIFTHISSSDFLKSVNLNSKLPIGQEVTLLKLNKGPCWSLLHILSVSILFPIFYSGQQTMPDRSSSFKLRYFHLVYSISPLLPHLSTWSKGTHYIVDADSLLSHITFWGGSEFFNWKTDCVL